MARLPATLPRFAQRSSWTAAHGFTLVELLVASAIALTVIGTLANFFSLFSRTASNSQAIVQMSSQLRSTANRLRQDLAGVTVSMLPPADPGRGAGYFELIEGPNTDLQRLAGPTLVLITATASILGDVDDMLLFTTRASGTPFHGKFGTNQIDSPVAEVAWFCRPAAVQPVAGLTLQNLYRRQLLVVSHVGAQPFHFPPGNMNHWNGATIPAVYTAYDLSLRPDAFVSALVPNSLPDLARRENRFAPSSRTSGTSPLLVGTTPYAVPATTNAGIIFDSASNREGEDVILGNVIGFDVRVFDPAAQPRLGTTPIYPHEQGYASLSSNATSVGGFVDLGCLAPGGLTTLTGMGNTKSGLAKTTVTGTAIYDTWSTHFESNGVDEDGMMGVDQDVNGIDDNSNGIPDDAGEAEVPPPYAVRLSAIEVRIRCYDPTSKEIRQITVRQQFRD